MRSVTYRFSPAGDGDEPGERTFHEHGVTLEAIHDIRPLDDGSVVAHYEVTGDPARVRRLFEGSCETVVDYQIADGPEETLLQLHFWPQGALADILDLYRSHAVMVDYPIEVLDHAKPTFRLTATGHIDELRGLIEGTRGLATVTIEEVGSYEPISDRLFAGLTARQQQVLQTALDRGYYDVPREVTYEDIAADLECSASTVGQHLRRIEATVLSTIAPSRERNQLQEPPVH